MILQVIQGHPVGLQGRCLAFILTTYQHRSVLSDIDTLFDVIKQGVLLFLQRLELLLQLIAVTHIAALIRRWSLLLRLFQLCLGLLELLAQVLVLLHGLLGPLLCVDQILLLQRQLLFEILHVATRVVLLVIPC